MTAQWIFLLGNLSDGLEAFGPYDDFDVMHDIHAGEDGWGMLLLPPCEPQLPSQYLGTPH